MEFGGIRPPVTAAASAAPVQLTPEEEALKRNTDCVYFLASPLTCKKGNECEYRHSEAARMNPRDCFYWLHGTCMNPKCAFRHPPLDGLVSRVPLKPPVPQPVAPVNKVAPCYYFQKGNCMKGDRCPFMHGPATRVSPSSQSTQKKGPSPPMPQKVDHNPKFIANNKPVSNPPMPVSNILKSLPKAGVATSYKPMLVNNNNSLPDEEEYHQSQFNVNRGAQVQNRERIFQSDERTQDSRDRDEFLGESSPGFDVLVDHDEEEDSRYVIPTEDNHHHNPYQTDETYLLDHDYEILPRIERERYAVLPEQDYQPEFDPYERKRPRRESSRDLDRSSRRRPLRDEAEDEIDGSDLRFRLMNKQRRVNGNGSDKRDHHRREERSHHHRREERHVEERRGTRLEGRIKIPERRPDSMHMEDRERRRNFRVSPARPPPVRQFEAKRPRSSEFVPGVGRPGFRRGEEDFSNFAGPKSLTELKGGKSGGEDRGRNRDRDRERERERESPLDFEGPKPLSVILKRKREAAGNGNNQIDDSTPKEEEAVKEEEVEEGMINENVVTEEKVTEEAAYDQNEYVEEEEYIEEGEEGGINGEEYQEGGEEEYIEEEEEDEDDFARKVGVVFT